MSKTTNKTTSAVKKSATTKNSKSGLTIVLVVVIVAVVAGGYWYYGRYKQQKLVKDYLKMMGLENSPYSAEILKQLNGQVPNSGDYAELLKQFGGIGGLDQGDTETDKEKTPAEQFAAAKEVKVSDSAKTVADEVSRAINEVFGKSKITSVASNVMGTGTTALNFFIPRIAADADGEALTAAFGKLGYTESSVSNDSGMFSATMTQGDEMLSLVIQFDAGEQEINIIKYDFSSQVSDGSAE